MDVSWWNDPSALIILLVLAMKHSSQLSSRTLAFASTIQPLVLLCISFFFPFVACDHSLATWKTTLRRMGNSGYDNYRAVPIRYHIN